MKKQFTAGIEKSSEKRALLIKDGMNRSMKEQRVTPTELASDKNKNCAMQPKTTFAKKDNLKKLSLAIATYFDAGKIGERLPFPSSTKNDDTNSKRIVYNKNSLVIDGQKSVMAVNSGADYQKKVGMNSKNKIEDKSCTGQGRPGSISSVKVKRDTTDTKQDSYRCIAKSNIDEKLKATLVREKTIPKFTTAGEKSTKQASHNPSNSFILNSQNSKHVKGSSMFKACINSISKRIDNLPLKDSKSKKIEKSGNLHSLTLFSDKAENSTVKIKQIAKDTSENRACLQENNSGDGFYKSTKEEGKYLVSKYLNQYTTVNKENENSRINYSGHSLGRSKLRESKQPHDGGHKIPNSEHIRDVSNNDIESLKNYQAKRSVVTKILKQPSGEYDLSNDSSKLKDNCTSKIKKNFTNDSRISLSSKSKVTASKLDIQKLHSRIKSNRAQRDPKSQSRIKTETLTIDYSISSSIKTLTAGMNTCENELLECEEAELRVSLRVEDHLVIDRQPQFEQSDLQSDTSAKIESNTIIDGETLKQMLLSEKEYQFNPHYLDTSGTNIKWNMRAILLNWIIEVSDDFGLKRSTFHYAANYIDRYLAACPDISVKSLQLVGLTALDLATKLEEIFIPGLKDFALVALNNYSVEDIQKMELHMLKVIKSLEGVKVENQPSDLLHLGQLVHSALGYVHPDKPVRHKPPSCEVNGQ